LNFSSYKTNNVSGFQPDSILKVRFFSNNARLLVPRLTWGQLQWQCLTRK